MPSLELSEKLMRQLTILADGLDLSAEETLQSLIDSTIKLQSADQSDFNHIASLYQATADLFHATDLDEVCQRIAEAVTREFRQVDCGVILVDNGKRELKRVARAGQHQVQVEAPLYIDGDGLVPEAIRTGEIVYAKDVRQHPAYLPHVSKTLSELVIPLATSRQVIGALDLQSMEVDGFDSQYQWLIHTFAQHAARAIENLMLYDEAHQHAELLEQAVRERTAELKFSRQRYQIISELGSDYAYSYRYNPDEEDFELEWMTQAFAINTGYSEEEMQWARQLTQIVVDDDIPIAQRKFLEMINSGAEVGWQHRIVTKAGEVRYLFTRLRPVVDEQGAVVRYYGSAQDQTELVLVEQKLREERNLLQTLINALPDHVYAKDNDLKYILVNDATVKYLGESDEAEILGKTDLDYFPVMKYEDWVQAEEHLLATGEPITDAEQYQQTVQGDKRWYLTSQYPIYDDDGQIRGLVGINRDVTAMKKVEHQLRNSLQRQVEANELKSRFVSMISHEFRTPLTSILLSTDLLHRYINRMTPDKRATHLSKIESQVKHLTSLIENFLTVDQAEIEKLPFKPQETNVRQLCEAVCNDIQTIAVNQQKVLHTTFEGDIPLMKVDENLFKLMVSNLLSNAVKYSDKGDVIEFKVKGHSQGIHITVQDEGIGIPISDQPKLFEVFHRAKNATNITGTGLGLTIVKQTVDLHGGQIEFESEEGVGTTFRVTMPKRDVFAIVEKEEVAV